MISYISYYRVSTQRQGKSGLGIDAQKTAVQNFIGANNKLIAEYEDIESGKNDTRPNLLKAIQHCKEAGAILLIAKLDRLSRNVSFIYTLKDSKIDFRCCDMPDANSVTIGIMAVLAQDERERISQRTKVALAELKNRGVKLGTPANLTEKARENSLTVRKQLARENENNRKASILIKSMRNEGKSYWQIANVLNENGFKTRRGKLFTQMQVKRLFIRE